MPAQAFAATPKPLSWCGTGTRPASRMNHRTILFPWLVSLVLAGCTEGEVRLGGPVSSTIPAGSPLAGELVKSAGSLPPAGPANICWSAQVLPAVIETVTEQSLLTQAKRGPDGTATAPATYQTRTQQRMVSDREDVWFQVPCPALMDSAFVATLQRALKVRGLYNGAATGVIDAATESGIRRYQAPQGIDSGVLSLAAARQLGLVAFDRAQLK